MFRRFIVVAALIPAVGCGVNTVGQKSTPPAESKQAAKRWTREEFRKTVVGKTPDEVIAAVGKPDRTNDFDDRKSWFYKELTTDPITDKVDKSITVRFKDGRVYEVVF